MKTQTEYRKYVCPRCEKVVEGEVELYTGVATCPACENTVIIAELVRLPPQPPVSFAFAINFSLPDNVVSWLANHRAEAEQAIIAASKAPITPAGKQRVKLAFDLSPEIAEWIEDNPGIIADAINLSYKNR